MPRLHVLNETHAVRTLAAFGERLGRYLGRHPIGCLSQAAVCPAGSFGWLRRAFGVPGWERRCGRIRPEPAQARLVASVQRGNAVWTPYVDAHNTLCT